MRLTNEQTQVINTYGPAWRALFDAQLVLDTDLIMQVGYEKAIEDSWKKFYMELATCITKTDQFYDNCQTWQENLNTSFIALRGAIFAYNIDHTDSEITITYRGKELTCEIPTSASEESTQNIITLREKYKEAYNKVIFALSAKELEDSLRLDRNSTKNNYIVNIPVLDLPSNFKLQIALAQKIRALLQDIRSIIENAIQKIKLRYLDTNVSLTKLSTDQKEKLDTLLKDVENVDNETSILQRIVSLKTNLEKDAQEMLPGFTRSVEKNIFDDTEDYRRRLLASLPNNEKDMTLEDAAKQATLNHSIWQQLDDFKHLSKQLTYIVPLKYLNTKLKTIPAITEHDANSLLEHFNFIDAYYSQVMELIQSSNDSIGQPLPLDDNTSQDQTTSRSNISEISANSTSSVETQANIILSALSRPARLPEHLKKHLDIMHKIRFPLQEDKKTPVSKYSSALRVWLSPANEVPRVPMGNYLKGNLIRSVLSAIAEYKKDTGEKKGKGLENAIHLQESFQTDNGPSPLSWEQIFSVVRDFINQWHLSSYRADSLAVKIVEAIFQDPDLQKEFFNLAANTEITAGEDKIVVRFHQLKALLRTQPVTTSPARKLIEVSFSITQKALHLDEKSPAFKNAAQELSKLLNPLRADLMEIHQQTITEILVKTLENITSANAQSDSFSVYLLEEFFKNPEVCGQIFTTYESGQVNLPENFVMPPVNLLIQSLKPVFKAKPVAPQPAAAQLVATP